MSDEDPTIICIDSDTDSDATVVFVTQRRSSRARRRQLSTTPQTEIAIKPFYGSRQLNRLGKNIAKKYEAIKQASEKIRKLLDANPKLLDENVESAETNAYICAITNRWDIEISELQLEHQRLASAVPGNGSKAQDADALLAKVKRMRWCCVCLEPAQICDLNGVFFCSIDCQLELLDA